MLPNKKRKKNETPIVDFLIDNREILNANFHALPISMINPKTRGYEKYKELFGNKYFSLETTVTGKIFDSFFYPRKCIKKAQDYTAELFGAKDTLFVTCGTSISNQIVIDALISEKTKVLLDRQSHQSMHFGVSDKHAQVDYFYSKIYCNKTERKYVDIEEILSKVKNAQESDSPYDVIILTAASYDGVIYNISEIIMQIIKVSPNIKFIIDEAWSAAFYFNEELYKYTAGYAAKQFENVDIISTQSAHKSLMTLRQASYIHSFASDEITQKLYKSRFKLHSTSPNYAILASMDLARSQMQSCGDQILSEALNLSEYVRASLIRLNLSQYIFKQENNENLEKISKGICNLDPLKIHVNIKHLGMSGSEIQEYLYHNHGVYFNRYTEDTLLLNIHMGVTQEQIERLLTGLKDLSSMRKNQQIGKIGLNEFIISYPPGIPLHTPGELVATNIYSEIQDKIKNGISVFQLY